MDAQMLLFVCACVYVLQVRDTQSIHLMCWSQCYYLNYTVDFSLPFPLCSYEVKVRCHKCSAVFVGFQLLSLLATTICRISLLIGRSFYERWWVQYSHGGADRQATFIHVYWVFEALEYDYYLSCSCFETQILYDLRQRKQLHLILLWYVIPTFKGVLLCFLKFATFFSV